MAKNEWFAEVRWCEDDIKCRLEDKGIQYNKELVDTIRSKMENGVFSGILIELGWEVMDTIISEVSE